LTSPAEPIANGELILPHTPGLGATLEPSVLDEHGFDPETSWRATP